MRGWKKGDFLHRRLVEVGQRGISVRSLGGNRAGEMRLTRLLRNKKFTVEAMLEHALERTLGRVRDRPVLAIQDTTSLRDDGSSASFALHPLIAVDAEAGTPLGLVHAALLKRSGGRKKARAQTAEGGSADEEAKRAIEEKESQRWLDGVAAAVDLKEAGALRVTVVADREADIYEAFAKRPAEVDLLIRASHDRALVDGSRMFAPVAAQGEAGRFEVEIPAAPGRKAQIAVRFHRVEIERPQGRKMVPETPKSVTVTLVEAREADAPEGVTPVLWRLPTTHEVADFAAARWICGLYRMRWLIEELFRTMKTRGFDIERVGIEEEPFGKLAVATLIAALDVMQLVMERDGRTKRPATDVFEADEQPVLEAVSRQLEGKTEKQKNPHPPGSLAFAAWVCARLGGWTGYYGKPGPVVMLRGLHACRAIQQGWRRAKDV